MKPLTTEKAVRNIELNNVLTFETDKRKNKTEIKKEIEELFSVKADKVSTLNKKNKKIAYVKLNKEYLAIDIATKLGMM